MALHSAAVIRVRQTGAQRSFIMTWGVPTTVSSPGNPQGNQPLYRDEYVSGDKNPTGYTALASGDTCNAEFFPAKSERSVQVTGTPGAGGGITLTGSNDGANFVTLHDMSGTALTGIQPGTIYQVRELTSWVQPVVVGGDGTTAMSVVIVASQGF